MLGGRERIDACETLLLRARADLDAGRDREAALQLRVGLEALLVELDGALADPGHEEDMASSRRAAARPARRPTPRCAASSTAERAATGRASCSRSASGSCAAAASCAAAEPVQAIQTLTYRSG